MNSIFLVVGPPAVGKSTTGRALATRFPRSLHIPVDTIRDMVVSGLELPAAVWSDALTQQIALARASVVHMALAYWSAGFAVVIDDFWDSSLSSDYHGLLNQPDTHKIVLYPAQTEAHRRNFQRSGESPAWAYIDEGIRIVYEQLNAVIPQLSRAGWIIMDTTALSVEATVTDILRQTTNEL